MATVFLLRQKRDDGIVRSSTVLTSKPDSFMGTYVIDDEYPGIPEHTAKEIGCIEGSREYVTEKLNTITEHHNEGQHGVGRMKASLTACDWKAELASYLSQLRDAGVSNGHHCPVACCENHIDYILEQKKDGWHCDLQEGGILSCPVYQQEVERTEKRIASVSQPPPGQSLQ